MLWAVSHPQVLCTLLLHPPFSQMQVPRVYPQGRFGMLALHMPGQSPNVGDPTSRQPRDRAGRQPRGPIHPSSSKGWDLGDTQSLGLWAPWDYVNQAAESMPREAPAKVLQQYQVIQLLRSTFVRGIGWAFYFQGFLHYSVFYLSPAETGGNPAESCWLQHPILHLQQLRVSKP